VTRACKALETFNSVLLVMATGLGKSLVFAEIARRMEKLGRVLVLAHRQELVMQALGHLSDLSPGVEMRDMRDATGDLRTNVTVGSIQSLVSRGRWNKLDYGAYSLVVIDEAHHAPMASYTRLIRRFAEHNVKILGVTATPRRGDRRALGCVFDNVAFEYGLPDAVRDGWLVPIIEALVTDCEVDFDEIPIQRGDYSESVLSAILEEEEKLHVLAKLAIDAIPRGPVVVFCPSVKHSKLLSEVINRYSHGKAMSVDGTTPQRQREVIISGFRNGDFPILCNCMIATEGFDCPSIASIIIARPTRSISFWLQMIGRGTRPLPGVVDGLPDAAHRVNAIRNSAKPELVVYDLYSPKSRKVPVSMADIFTGIMAPADSAKLKVWAASQEKPVSITDLIARAEEMERERDIRRQLGREPIKAVRVTYKTQYRDPFTLFGIVPTIIGSGDKPTEWQLQVLKQHGVEDGKVTTREDADKLIATLTSRSRRGLASYKQMRLLVRHKVSRDVALALTRDEAAKLIVALKNGNWLYFSGIRLPKSLHELENMRKHEWSTVIQNS